MQGGRLQRVDAKSWEIAQVGVEYYSNNQYVGLYGTVFTRCYAIPDSVGTGKTVYIPLGFSWGGTYYVINLQGVAIIQGGNEYLPLPNVDYGSSNRNIEFKVAPPNIVIIGGAEMDWQAGGYIQLDYKK